MMTCRSTSAHRPSVLAGSSAFPVGLGRASLFHERNALGVGANPYHVHSCRSPQYLRRVRKAELLRDAGWIRIRLAVMEPEAGGSPRAFRQRLTLLK